MKSSYILGALLPLCIIASSYAVTPSTAPDGVSDPGWLFALYFQNIAENPCTSSTDLVTGFLWTQDATYLTPQCTNIGKLSWSFFSAYTNTDTTKVITGFNATTGAPIYATPTTAWKEVTGGITYTGGNITIQSGNILAGNVGLGSVWVYDPTKTQSVWSMGSAYTLPSGGGTTTYGTPGLYGLGWSYNPDYGAAGNNPQSKPGLNHQLLLMMGGTTYTALGNGIWTNGNITTNGSLSASGNATIAGTVTAAAPTASWHLATKAYVDAAVSAGGGGWFNIYQADGTTLVGKFLTISRQNATRSSETVCEATYYADTSGHVQNLNAYDCIGSVGTLYFPNATCAWSIVLLPYFSYSLEWLFRNNTGTDYAVISGWAVNGQ